MRIARYLITGSILLLAPEAGHAGDTWSGPYVGLTGGLSTLSHDGVIHQTGPVIDIPYGSDFDEKLWGGLAGFNVQNGNLVFGLEGAYLASPGDTLISKPSSKYEVDQQGQAEALLRIGYDAGRFMPFAAAGIARSTFDIQEFSIAPPVPTGYDAQPLWGFTAGAGVEWQAAPHLRLRAEYRYTSFSPENFDFNTLGTYDQTNSFASSTGRISALLNF